jgi:hypothetical protein
LPALLRVTERLIRDEWLDAEAIKASHGSFSKHIAEAVAEGRSNAETPKKRRTPKPKPKDVDDEGFEEKTKEKKEKKRRKLFRVIPERTVGDLPESVERLVNVQEFPDGEEPFLRTCDICKCVIFSNPAHDTQRWR